MLNPAQACCFDFSVIITADLGGKSVSLFITLHDAKSKEWGSENVGKRMCQSVTVTKVCSWLKRTVELTPEGRTLLVSYWSGCQILGSLTARLSRKLNAEHSLISNATCLCVFIVIVGFVLSQVTSSFNFWPSGLSPNSHVFYISYDRFSSCAFNMGSLSGILQRPVIAAAIVTVASLSTDFSDKRWSLQLLDGCSTSGRSHSSLSNSVPEPNFSRVSYVSFTMLANLSFVTRVSVPVPNVNFPFNIRNPSFGTIPLGCSVAYSPLIINLYQSAELAKGPKPMSFKHNVTTSSPDVLYIRHLPEPNAFDITGTSNCSSEKSRTVVVLLGWLGSEQKHLKKYAEWNTSRGFHAITFTFPMAEILSYQVGGKAERDIELLVEHLANWLEEEHQKKLVFHTFSNTGWLTYGVILEKLQKQDPSLFGRIGGCIVDSAPVAIPDPQVWASGFSAAFLKKSSVATKMHSKSDESNAEPSLGIRTTVEPKPAVTEAALLFILKKFFGVVLNLPSVNRRLSDVLNVLSSRQPRCPQLYIYSSADRVIPAGSVESFIEEQRKAGLEVRACNFVSTPHVDHFRNDPKLYTTQLTQFLEDCVLTCCRNS